MLLSLLAAMLAAQVPTDPQVQIGPQVPPQPTLQLPPLPASGRPAKPTELERPRIPIDLGPDAPVSELPQQIDILAPPQVSEAADAVQRLADFL